MPTMIISSPSSAALQAGASSCSPTRSNRFPSIRPHRDLSSSSQPYSAAATASSSSSPAAAPATIPAPTAVINNDSRHYTLRSPLSPGVEEIRAALSKHSVNGNPHPSSAEPSGDNSRGSMSAGPETLGGESRQFLANTTVSSSKAAADAVAATSSGNGRTASPGDGNAKRQLPDAAAAASDGANDTSAQVVSQPDDDVEQSRSKRVRPPAPAVKLLPRQYEFVDPNDMVILISSMIMELIQYNDKIPLQGGKLTRFHSRTPPRISVRDYLQRLTTHATLSPPILLSMVYYIDRLCALYPAFTVSSLTVHRFLIASATVASKGLSDSFWTNKTYARVGGISISELAMLELEFLWRVEWKIVPQPEVLVDYYLSLVERCELYALEPETSTVESTSQPIPSAGAPP